jgi:hypothetical protein
MILMSQNSLLDGNNVAVLADWYLEHLRNMSSVPGIFSAQRFKTMSGGYPRSVALYSVVSEQAFDSDLYRGIAGFGAMKPLIDERDHHVDLFEGLDAAPVVGDDERLLLADRKGPGGAIAGIPFTWLKCVARDFSTPYRGIAVLAADKVPALDATVAVYRPVTKRYLGFVE